MPTCWTAVSGMPGSANAAAGRCRSSGRRSGPVCGPCRQKLPEACVSVTAKVNRRQQVRLDGNWYSVPPEYVGRLVTVHAYVFRVTMAYQDQVHCLPCPQLWPGGRGPGTPPLPAGLAAEAWRLRPGHADPEVAAAGGL